MLPTQSDLTFWQQRNTPKWASQIVSGIISRPTVTIDAVVNSHVPRVGSFDRKQLLKQNTMVIVCVGRKHTRDLTRYLLQIELAPGLPDRGDCLRRAALVRRWRKRIIKERNRKIAHIPPDYRDWLEL